MHICKEYYDILFSFPMSVYYNDLKLYMNNMYIKRRMFMGKIVHCILFIRIFIIPVVRAAPIVKVSKI